MSPETADALSFVTLDQFLAKLPPGLRVLHDGGTGPEPLRWVEPSELVDPTPYLVEGELVLTTGLPFLGSGAEESPDAYARRLVDAGVRALGFGLQPHFDTVPDEVVAACRRQNLTLLEIPESIPFAAIGLEFSRLLETDSARVFRELAEANRQLMRAVLSGRPEHELLTVLVQRVPVWAILFGADGRIRARSQGARGQTGVGSAALAPLLERLLSGHGPRVETDSFDAPESGRVVGHPLRSTKDATLGALVLGSDAALTPAQNNVVSSAVGLLELLFRQRTSGSLAPSQLATTMLLHPESVTTGGTRLLNGLKDLLAQSTSSSRSTPLRVVQGIKPGAPEWPSGDSPVREVLQWRRIFDTKLVELTEYGFAAITRLKVDDALLADVERLGWRLVVGDQTELSDLPNAYQRASALRPRVQSSGRSARLDEENWTVAGLLGPVAGSMLASRLLAPLLALEPGRRDTLLGVLRGWLHENGNWDATAKALGLHRNSVRRQIGVVADLLELDLGQAQSRAELWFALQYADDALQTPQAP